MKSYRFIIPKTKRDILLKIINNELNISDITYLKLTGHLIGSIYSHPNINMRAIDFLANKIQNKQIEGKIINNYEPFTNSWTLYDNKLSIKNGNLQIIQNWIYD